MHHVELLNPSDKLLYNISFENYSLPLWNSWKSMDLIIENRTSPSKTTEGELSPSHVSVIYADGASSSPNKQYVSVCYPDQIPSMKGERKVQQIDLTPLPKSPNIKKDSNIASKPSETRALELNSSKTCSSQTQAQVSESSWADDLLKSLNEDMLNNPNLKSADHFSSPPPSPPQFDLDKSTQSSGDEDFLSPLSLGYDSRGYPR